MRTVIYGASDDLVEIDGDGIREEFNVNCEQAVYVGLSTGDCFRITYDGIWNIKYTHGWRNDRVEIVSARDEDDNSYDDDGCPAYSDKAIISDSVDWVVVGEKA